MMKRLLIAFALSLAGCGHDVPESEEAAIAADDADAEIKRLDERIDELETKLNDLDTASDEAKQRADDAQVQAEEADRQAKQAQSDAEDACQPFGYQPGCGNSR